MYDGKKVGLITNDQASELVDTAILSRHEVKVAEVSGSCFCCNFNGLIDAMKKVRSEANADIIIAEPVGSCTDLSATILQPLKENLKGELVVSPFSVMADPEKLSDILSGGNAGLHPNAAYIYWKQLEESDIILISKTDTLTDSEIAQLKERTKIVFPNSEVMTISSKASKGIEEWLNEVLNRTDAGKRIVEVDYDRYAEGEAVLGWLNSTIELTGESVNWDAFSEKLMRDLSKQFDELGAAVGHVKMMLESGNKFITGNITGLVSTLNFRGSAGTGNSARLTLNARVEMSPEQLEKIVCNTLDENAKGNIKADIVALKCLMPGRPNPTFRFSEVV